MNRTRHFVSLVIATISLFIMGALLSATSVIAQDEGEIASVGPETVKSWMEEGKAFIVLDVRTPSEFVFVGHPVGAVNITFWFWDPESGWSVNEDFVGEVESRLDKNDTIITMCVSGVRAKHAAEKLSKTGYKSVFPFTDGFEGPKDENGLRTLSGWKVNGLPYNYEGEPYIPGKTKEGEEEQGESKDPE